MPRDIGIVVVTYHPGGDFESRLARMAAQGGALVIVDNASKEAERDRLEKIGRTRHWEMIANPTNVGLGAALNQGVRHLAKRGFRWVLLFDQDSEPAPDMSQRMVEALQRNPEYRRVAVIGPGIREQTTGREHQILRQHPRWRLAFEKVSAGSEDLPAVTMVITSGSLLKVSDFESLGPFDEGFFVDYIDTDYCLRCLANGRRIAVSAAARLDHSLGLRDTRTWCGFEVHPTNHSVVRHYYIARNRIPMWRRHGWKFPHWWIFDCAAAMLWSVRVITVEADKWKKIQAAVLGTWDGLRGRLGPCPEERQHRLG